MFTLVVWDMSWTSMYHNGKGHRLHKKLLLDVNIKASAGSTLETFLNVTGGRNPVATDSNHRQHAFWTHAYTQPAVLSAMYQSSQVRLTALLRFSPLLSEARIG